MKRALVIGYGNTLRSDDGAGVRAAEDVARRLPDAETVTVHELQPELAETMSHYQDVVFLDAGAEIAALQCEILTFDGECLPDSSHGHSPRTLLSLCHTLYDHAPERTLVVAIPAESFAFGEELTPTARAGVEQAVRYVERFLKG